MNNNNQAANLWDMLKVLPQYFIPQHFLTSLVYRLTRCETPWFKNFIINQFIKVFKVDMSLALNPDPESRYNTRRVEIRHAGFMSIFRIFGPASGGVSFVKVKVNRQYAF